MTTPDVKIAVVIPCYNVKAHVLDVLAAIGSEVCNIYVVDDGCPQASGSHVEAYCTDPRVTVLRNPVNQGVGGAVMLGYQAAIGDGMDIIVKIDGDGQMDPDFLSDFVAPIIHGEADYTKGNRFFDLEGLRQMPRRRLFGNAALSFLSKLSSGYWNIFDPTNGYTAIHRDVARHLPFDKISRRYFFETDMLFRLNTLRAVVIDIPMDAKYAEEVSGLKISSIFFEFLGKHLRNLSKRIFYSYYLRDMSLASLELPLGLLLVTGGGLFGLSHWAASIQAGVTTPAGTVMLSALPIILGVQLILAFIGHDVQAVPRRAFHLQRKRTATARKTIK